MNAPAATATPAQAAYLEHIATCEAGWCAQCRALARAADVEDGQRFGWPERAQHANTASRCVLLAAS